MKNPVYFMIRHPKQINEPKASNSFVNTSPGSEVQLYLHFALQRGLPRVLAEKINIYFFNEKLYHNLKNKQLD
jgi:hypothetical protein